MVGGRLLGVSTASLRSFSRRPRKKVWQRDSATTRGGLSFPHAVPNIIFLARMAPPVGDSVAFARRRRRRPSPPFERGRAKGARHRDTHSLAPSRPPATCRVAVLLLPPPLGQRPLYQEARSDDGASSPPILRFAPSQGRAADTQEDGGESLPAGTSSSSPIGGRRRRTTRSLSSFCSSSSS